MSELEVQFKPETGKAVVEGKTTVAFQSFVTLILQRKVLSLFKQWGKAHIIVDSELLTSIASAPQDSVENRGRVITVSLWIGALAGIALFAAFQALLLFSGVPLQMRELILIVGGIAVIGILGFLLMRVQRMKKSDKLVETIEGVASFLSK